MAGNSVDTRADSAFVWQGRSACAPKDGSCDAAVPERRAAWGVWGGGGIGAAFPILPGTVVTKEYRRTLLLSRTGALAVGATELACGCIEQTARMPTSELWRQAVAVTAANLQSLPAYRFVASLDELNNIHEARLTALRNQMPIAVMFMLIGTSIVAMWFTGYNAGQTTSDQLHHVPDDRLADHAGRRSGPAASRIDQCVRSGAC